MKEYYNNNKEFKDYVDMYARDKNISVDVALTHKVIKLYLDYLLNKDK